VNTAKQILLAAYYYGQLPYRSLRGARRAADGQAPVMALFYHRVADAHPNGWTMPTDCFVEQIDWLAAHFDLISLAEAQTRIRAGSNHHPAVCVTFDDGYAENCAFALPLLLGRKIPVTYFVSVEHVTHGRPFPHDVEAGAPLRPNTLDEVRELARAGVEIGAHTRTHADLGQVTDRDELIDEMVTSRDELAAAIGRPIRYFAFPFGQPRNMTAEAFELARVSGYAGVCSAYGGYNFPGGEWFHLQRIHADPDLLRMKNWLSVDPRKERLHPDVYAEGSTEFGAWSAE
jgi:peptidoglycan/xylan/chitin deacetylase (PgdA/CDA1 family)